MRYIGNKTKLLEWIYAISRENGLKEEMSVFDCFAGTGVVGEHFKSKGHKVYSSDIMYFSFLLQKARIEISDQLKFEYFRPASKQNNLKLIENRINEYFKNLPLIETGFVYNTYSPSGSFEKGVKRMYFTDIVGKRIDTIRVEVERLFKNALIDESEYFYLLACLIYTTSFYSNTAGVYGAFHKSWDPRALKDFNLRFIPITYSKRKNKAFLGDSSELIKDISCDVLYMDPPYNSRQYAPNYHVLESIARYDSPEVKGVSGMRDYSDQKSDFCIKKKASEALNYMVQNTSAGIVLLSYNDEGLLSKEEISEVLSKHGNIRTIYKDHLRYKSKNHQLGARKMVKEKLYILHKR